MSRKPVESTLESAAENFGRDGYIFVPDFWTQRQTQTMLANLNRYMAEVMPTVPEKRRMLADANDPSSVFRLEHMDVYDDWFDRLNHDDRVTSLMKVLLNDDLVYQRVAFFGKRPNGGEATPPHQDGYYFKLTPNNALTCWIPLDLTDEANGCMRYVPGSHLLPMRDHVVSQTYGFSLGIDDYGARDLQEEVLIPCKPGDLLVHHSMTIHRAETNKSDRHRRSLGLVYFAASGRPDEAAVQAHAKKMQAEWEKSGKR